MPYVTVTSRGGPHDDAAFVAGWVCGRIDAQLATIAAARAVATMHVPPSVVPQVDLIAMRHRYLMTAAEAEPDAAYVEVTLRPEPCPRRDT
jgi:hypothetical protein